MRETVTPGGAVAGGNPPRVPMSTSFLAQWINIALKQEAIAREDRERANAAGEDRQRWIEAVQDELQASMVAISASAHAIDALYGTTRDLIDLPPGTVERWTENRTPRGGQILETLKCACELRRHAARWGGEFSWLFDLRDSAVHHESPLNEPVPHPGDPTGSHVAKELADYELGAATRATNLAVEVAVGRRPSAFREAIASGEDGLGVSATTNTARVWPSQAAAIDVRP